MNALDTYLILKGGEYLMQYKSALTGLLVAAAMAVSAQAALATPNTKVNLVQDCSTGCAEAVDMEGPTGFGFVNFNQNADGDLRVTVSLKNAEPNTTYSGVFLVCGPSHASACGYVDVGDLTTNGQGNGNATMILAVEDLQDSPFGPGARTDHFDLIAATNATGGVYAASGIDYVVPTP